MLEAGALLDMAVALFKRYKSLFVILPLATLLALSHCSDKRHTRQRDEARATLAQNEVKYETNLAQQKAQIEALKASYADKAKENVRVETQIRTVYRDRADAYADRMRKGKVCGSAPVAPSEGPNPAQPDGPSGAAVILERRDYDILVENSARLEAAHRWALSLIEDGTAEAIKAGVPEPAFGQ